MWIKEKIAKVNHYIEFGHPFPRIENPFSRIINSFPRIRQPVLSDFNSFPRIGQSVLCNLFPQIQPRKRLSRGNELQSERTDCAIQGNGLQSERMVCLIRVNELPIRGNELLIR